MPVIFKFGCYVIYFWLNENQPLEPLHVHVAMGHPVPNATKLWITSKGKVIVCNNNSKIPDKILHKIIRAIEADADVVIGEWLNRFGEIRYYDYEEER